MLAGAALSEMDEIVANDHRVLGGRQQPIISALIPCSGGSVEL